VLLSFAIATVAVRGGNDSYEAYSLGELDAMNYAYAHAVTGQTIGIVSSFVPYGQEKILSVPVFAASDGGTPTVKHIEANFVAAHPKWIVLSQSQEAWGQLIGGYQAGWEANLEVVLIQNGYTIVKNWPTATVLRDTKSA
jgi:hypothetical protein